MRTACSIVCMVLWVGCGSNAWLPCGRPTCEQLCMHRHLHASRVVVVDEPRIRAGNGRVCTCAATPDAATVWLTLTEAGEHPAVSGPVVTIPE